MEIVRKAIVSVNDKSEEVMAIIDTGAERTMINEEVLLKVGAPHLGNRHVHSMGEFRDIKSQYGADIEINGCGFGLVVLGGKKNIIGHDFLQLAKAVINEETGEIKLTKDYIEY
jgi:predicted aspartyl protease